MISDMFCSLYIRFEFLYKFLNRFLKYLKYIRLNCFCNKNFSKNDFDRFETKKKKLKTTLSTINIQIY